MLYPSLFQEAAQSVVSDGSAAPGFAYMLPSWNFDYQTGEFITDGAGHVQLCTPQEAWEQWLYIAISTPSGMLVYGDEYGIDEARLRNLPYPAFCSELAAQITRICRLHPMTAAVGNFKFSSDGGDAVFCSFKVSSSFGSDAIMSREVLL